MSGQDFIEGLKKKAALADDTIIQIKTQLADIRKLAISRAIQAEEQRLQQENETLRRDILKLKEDLCQAETRRGVVQVNLPSETGSNSKMEVTMEKVAASTANKENQPTEKPAKQKAKKEKAGGKPKPEPQADKPMDVSRLNMKIGHIVNCKKHPDADGLYVEEVNVGEERNRTIVSGLVKHIELAKMQDRMAIFLCNLKPAKMRGILSEGMIMCGSTPEKVEIIEPPAGVVPGERVTVAGFPGEPDALLNPKKKIWEQIQPDLKINDERFATYKGALWTVGEKGSCQVATMKDSNIK